MHAVFQFSAGIVASQIVAYMSAACVLILIGYHVICEICWLMVTGPSYFKELWNWVQWLLYITATLFVIPVYINHCGCASHWQWQVGIVSVLLVWLDLIMSASNIPGISLFVIMFREIASTFFRLIFFALLLIIAFTLMLFMMFHNPTHTAKVQT